MPRPHYDPAEIARSALAEMPSTECVELLVELLCASCDALALLHARNAITDRASDLLALDYADQIIGENHRERVL